MKKYDFALVALYSFGCIIAMFLLLSIEHRQNRYNNIAKELVSNPNVTQIEIRNSKSAIRLCTLPQSDTPEYKMRGYITSADLDNNRVCIEDNTLHIDSLNRSWFCVIKVNDEVDVVVENSPNVKWLTEEEYVEKLKENKFHYDF
ncbi:MAG: hypothetical protein SNF68_02885 [Rikenellaceae bacterium]